MFCTNCGNKLADGDVFCSGCGTKVNAVPAVPETPAENIPEAPKAFKGLIFDEKEPSYSNAKPLPDMSEAETDFDKTVIAPQGEDFKAEEAETEIAPAPDFAAVKSPLFREDDVLLAEASLPAEEVTEIMPAVEDEQEVTQIMPASEDEQDVTVMMPAAEDATEMMSEETEFSGEQETVFAQPDEEATSLLREDSYNVYSGAVPGVTSQDFRYPTNDNAYPDRPTEMSPAFDPDATQGFDYGVQTQAAYEPPVAPAYQPPYNPYENYPPQQTYDAPAAPPKKNTAMWVIIICISIIIVALGASCAVILTQYDSFGDFFASFSDEKGEDGKDDGDKDKDDESTTKPVETTEPTTVEPTTAEPTTAPRAYDGYCGAQLQYDFDESTGILAIFGTGEMSDYSNLTAPWASHNVAVVIVEEGVTSVTAGAFSEISPSSISVPSTVASFDVLAVDMFGAINVSPSNPYFSSSNGVLFDKNMTQLIAYPNMSVSTSYAVPDSVKWIGEYAFYKATNLNYLILGTGVELIGDYAFKDCYNVRNFEIPANVTEVRTGIFSGWVENQNIRIMNPETQAVSDWNEGCAASVVIG